MLNICRITIRRLLVSHRYSTVALKIPATEVKLSNASLSCELVSKTGSVVGTYPYVWLRDNCRCSQCFHPSSRARRMLMANLDPDIIPVTADIDTTAKELHIQWPDKHSSQFPLSWLRENQFSKMPKDPVSDPSQRFWGSEMQDKIPSFLYTDVQNSDKCLHDWIESLQIYGLALIKGAPKQEGVVREIGKRISFLRPSHYGETFQVMSKVDAGDLSYTDGDIGLHNDLNMCAYVPNIQMLHCIKQAAIGGENQFCDGFKVAEDLRLKNGEVFHILSTTPIDFRDCDGTDLSSYHVQYRRPTIELLPDGRYEAVNYSDIARAPYQSIPVENVHTVYKALKSLSSEMNNQENKIETKMDSGDVITFDNRRVFHARSGFTVTKSDSRLLEGAFLNWDEVRSRRRVIRDQMLNQQPL